ncbi:NdufS6, NADH-ubiquinone oxidoreductase complex I 13kd subunit [Agaricus bisporus var. burnettii JB137-S8]|uniref:NdufS6, NADH-ubiquinone oxidoreductase complex I 13kd subunit n=1 Tax=Agaricus bisporus var. burnettii (strain JB137-S8 / ATCC MYA-4627 / FGSC 10392) TaxID=597362 RepID=K5X7I9_AGABU|nr:NdufS6 NADH-ubiquinone oxidoreductase complex I 13kd subunit [Agaricus bisporus var. bisporus H97]XP_007325283.1 NdufS6, NADH-ubiquinone oxidoreductase complex I 13kd subunit [Agaricus bisporus var. burnettii JB137-S8]EKM83886.1 NdufS6, NADH-ubiquinone oxidoreductase complex I 13kd subunit [Agaricus bisporus var. burnettii JB137-S8]EKV51352.1 NdufS6 NADH-ubiquinone oxidoreductase complex I 13kd subunit [Agaricus bisporus var. bisporus H97]
MLSRRAVVQLASPLRRALSTTRPLGNDSPISVEKPELSKPKQAPNQPTTWTASQRLRPGLGSSPRFEQTNIDLQPNPLSAMELVSQEPVRVVDGRKAVCDGGGGPLGHPKIYINLDKPGPRACGFSGLRFEQAQHHH